MKIGVDLGGTNIRAGLVDDGLLIRKVAVACPPLGGQHVVNKLCELIGSLMSDAVTSIGVGVPSVVDRETGIVYNAVNIRSWHEVHLKDILQAAFHKPVYINNDANCFAWGEYLFGGYPRCSGMVGLTIGTGIGTGLVFNGKLYNGRNTGAGEVGAMPFRQADYEFYCASRFFMANYQTSGKQLADEARRGSVQSLKIWQEFGDNIGHLIKAVLYAYDPELIVLGGSISQAFQLFEAPMRACMSDFPWPRTVQNLTIMPSQLKDAALLGAAMLNE